MRKSETWEAALGFPKAGAERIAPLAAAISRFSSRSSSALECDLRQIPFFPVFDPELWRAGASADPTAGRESTMLPLPESERPEVPERRESPCAAVPMSHPQVFGGGGGRGVTVWTDPAKKDVLHVMYFKHVMILVTTHNLVYMQHIHTLHFFYLAK